jgi:probable F420-dependent oxidoreductase
MRVGIHLPQFGRAITPGGTQQAAVLAEQLGFDDVWVSDHLVVPEHQSYPAPYLYDPLVCLSFAAAVTTHVGLGTSVLVGPQYASPLALANSLATLDSMSAGRLIAGIGIGWSQAEYEALHASWDHRGERLDEIIDLFRTAWRDDPATHDGRFYGFRDIRLQPKPAHDVPIWVGGTSDAALERALTRGDGYHGIQVEPDAAAALVERIRARRPAEEFTISLRVGWDGTGAAAADLNAHRDAYEAAGVQHLLVAPGRGDLATWLAEMHTIATTLGLTTR